MGTRKKYINISGLLIDRKKIERQGFVLPFVMYVITVLQLYRIIRMLIVEVVFVPE